MATSFQAANFNKTPPIIDPSTATVASELQQTWNREDAQKWAEVYTRLQPTPHSPMMEAP